MKEKIVFTHDLSDQEFRALDEAFSGSDISIKALSTLSTDQESESKACAVFVGVEGSENLNRFQEKLNAFKKINIFVVLRHKNFELLMLAFKNKVNDVFLGDLSAQNIDVSKVKLKLAFEDVREDLPKLEILDLFSSPIDISTTNHLFFALNNYLENFESVRNIGILKFEAGGIHLRGQVNEQLDFTALNEVDLSERFIGETVRILEGEYIVLATPVHHENDQYHWLILEMEDAQIDYVLNDLFFRFLENVHLFKKTKESERTLEVLAATDDVTGLYNQRKLSEDLEQVIVEHEKLHDTFSILFIDVDHFKEVNDNHGHLIGSQILTDLGKLLADILRKSDHIYRYGGDEFVIIMPTINVEKVHEVAVRLLNQIKSHRFEIDNNEFYDMSVSIGIAEYPTDAKSAGEIIKFADDMMYLSKNSGRGKVFHLKEVQDVNTRSK